MLTAEQRNIYEIVIDSVDNAKGLLLSIDACGGSGKTFLLTTILARVRSQRHIALATATSGIAATLLPNGRTLHSRLKVPINIDEHSSCNVDGRSSTARLLSLCKLLVIDEVHVTMAHRNVYEAIDRSLRDVRRKTLRWFNCCVFRRLETNPARCQEGFARGRHRRLL